MGQRPRSGLDDEIDSLLQSISSPKPSPAPGGRGAGASGVLRSSLDDEIDGVLSTLGPKPRTGPSYADMAAKLRAPEPVVQSAAVDRPVRTPVTPVTASRPSDDRAFQSWYAQQAKQYDLNPNPDAPEQDYDYRAAFKANAKPALVQGVYRWPSDFKKPGHPNEIAGGFNTITGQRAPGVPQASEAELVRLGWDPETAARLSRTEPPTLAAATAMPRMEPVSAHTRAQDIRPEVFQPKLQRVLARMAEVGHPMTVASGGRSAEQQRRLFNQGRGDPGPIVTELDGTIKRSHHQSGTGADLAFVVNGRPSFDDGLPWDVLGKIAQEEGLTWGGKWISLPDRPHVQLGDTLPPSALPPMPMAVAHDQTTTTGTTPVFPGPQPSDALVSAVTQPRQPFMQPMPSHDEHNDPATNAALEVVRRARTPPTRGSNPFIPDDLETAPAPAPAPAPTLVGEATRGAVSGLIAGPAEGLAATGEAFGLLDPSVRENVRATNRTLQPAVTADVFENPAATLGDPMWWAHTGGQVAGSVLSLMGAGSAGVAAATRAGQALKLGPEAASRLIKIGGPAAATLAETWLESFSAYAEIRARGGSESDAATGAAKVAAVNLPLLGATNLPLFNPQTKSRLLNAIFGGVLEGPLQEVPQQMATNVAVGDPLSEGLGTAAVVGTLAGTAFGGIHRPARTPVTAPPDPQPVQGPTPIAPPVAARPGVSESVGPVAPSPEPSPVVPAAVPAAPSIDLGGMGQAISDNLYRSMFERLQAGKLPEPFDANQQSTVARAVKDAWDAGQIASIEDVKAVAHAAHAGLSKPTLDQEIEQTIAQVAGSEFVPVGGEAYAGPDRRVTAGTGPDGVDRRNAPIDTTNPTAAAQQMMEENPNIIKDAAELGQRARDSRKDAPPRQPATLDEEIDQTIAEAQEPPRHVVDPDAEGWISKGWDGKNMTIHERRELTRMRKEMESVPFTKHTFNEAGVGKGGGFEIVGGAGGAPVFTDINTTSSRDKVIAAIQKLLDGKMTADGNRALQAVRKRIRGEQGMSAPILPIDAGNEPGITYVEVTPDMTPAEAAVERPFRQAVEQRTAEMVEAFRAKFPEVISADDAKEMSTEYARSNETRAQFNRAVHRASSALANARYQTELQEPPAAGKEPTVTFVAGPTGVGKTTVRQDSAFAPVIQQSQIVVDGPLTHFGNAERRIQAALDAGKSVSILYVHQDPVTAWEGVIERAGTEGRQPNLEYHVQAHVSGLETIRKLANRFADDAVTIEYAENPRNGTPHLIQASKLPEAYNEGDVRARIEALGSPRKAEVAAPAAVSRAAGEGVQGSPRVRTEAPARPAPKEVAPAPAPPRASTPVTPTAEPRAPREFSSTQVDLPAAIAADMSTLAQSIPDADLAEDGREDKPHVTVKFGLHTDDVADVRRVLAGERPITVTLGKTSIFPAKEGADYDVVKVEIDSPDLHRLNAKIADALDHTDTHPTYKPHATIAYVKAGLGQKYVGRTDLDGKTITLDAITFSGKNRETVSVPLDGGRTPVTATAAASKPSTPVTSSPPPSQSTPVADPHRTLVARYKLGNPFAEKAARARAHADRLNAPTAHEKGMAESFPLGAGFGHGSAAARGKKADASVDRAAAAVKAMKDADYLEAQAAAFDAGTINAQGRSITPASEARSEKRETAQEKRDARIATAKDARGDKAPWRVPGSVWADATGNLGGGARKLILSEHREAVEAAIAEGKDVPANVLAEYPDLAPATADKPYGKDAMQEAFNLTPAQAAATDALVQAMGLDTEKIRVVKGGLPGDGALTQLFDDDPPADLLDTGEEQPRLPGAEDVREQEVATPEFDRNDEFRLTGELVKRKGQQDTLFQEDAPFYSRLQRAVENATLKKASGQQWKATIKNAKGGINKDEFVFAHVDDLADGTVYAKDEVLAYLKANELRVEPVVLGLRKQGNGFTGEPTHFDRYQEPGADEGSYREVLLTVPAPPSAERFDPRKVKLTHKRQSATQGSVRVDYDGQELGTYADDIQLRSGRWEGEPDDYWLGIARRNFGKAEGWFDGHEQYNAHKNPIVRVRFNVRTSDGQRTMFLEEVQPPSKANQEKMPDLLRKNWREISFKWALRYAAENGLDAVAWTTGEMQAGRYSLEKHVDEIHYTKKSNGTYDLTVWKDKASIDRAERMGASLADLEALVGKEVAQRIERGDGAERESDTKKSLRARGKAVDAFPIKWEVPTQFAGRSGAYVRIPDAERNAIKDSWAKWGIEYEDGSIMGSWTDEKSARKEIARQNADLEDAAQRVLSGDGLKIGGEGLKRLYDVDFPNVVKNLPAVKRAGVKVETARIEATDFGKRGRPADWKQSDGTTTPVPTIQITPQLREAVLGGQALFQPTKGAVEFTVDGKAIIRGLEAADVSTGIHEIAHVARRQLFDLSIPAEQRYGITDEDIRTAERWAGADTSGRGTVWAVEAEEKFARGFERYLHDGHAPTPELKSLFAKFRDWLRDIYTKLKGSEIDIHVSKAMRQVFDRLVSRGTAVTPTTAKRSGAVLANKGPHQGLPRPPAAGATPVKDRMRPSAIIAKLRKGLGDIPVSIGRFKHQALGIYKVGPQAVRVRVANDVQTIAHELGHHIDHAILGISRKDARWRDELTALGQPTSRPSYTLSEQRQEGAAEFLRLYLTEPATAQADAPAYFAEFERKLDEHADLKKVLHNARTDLAGLISQDPATRGKMRIDFTGQDSAGIYQRLKDDPKGELRHLTTLWVDDLHALSVAVDEMRDAQPIDARQNAYVLARNARGTGGMAEGFLEHGVRGRNGRFLSGSFGDAITPVKAHLEDFASYLVALRVLEVQALKGKETGMTADEARAIIRQVESGPHADAMARARDNVYAYQQGLLQYAREYHAISKEQHAKLLKEVNYVPLQRVMDAITGSFSGSARKIANRTTPIKRLKGSGRDIINPLESIIRNTFAIIDMVEKNRAMQALVRQADKAAGSAKWLERVPTPDVATKFNLSQIQKDVRAELEDMGIDLPDNFDLDGMVKVFTPASFVTPGQNLVTVIRDGDRQFYEVHDQPLYDAITAIGGQASASLVEWASSKATSLLRAGATLTPGFIARNPTRDTLVAFMQSRYGFIPVYDTIRGFLSIALGDADAKLFFTSGIQQSALVGADRDRLRKMLRDMPESSRVAFFKNVALHPIDMLRALSENMEAATRVGEFRLGLNAAGKERRSGTVGVIQRLTTPNTRATDDETLARATLAARDVTTDFSRGGVYAKNISRYKAFFNARVQGYVRMAETAKRDPLGTVLNATALALFSYALWWANSDEDEYDEIPDWEKSAYWHIPANLLQKAGARRTGFIKVAKPFEWAYLANVTEAALAYVKGKNPDALARIKPETDPGDIVIAMFPSILLPAAEAYFDYDSFRDTHIVKPWDVGLQPELQKSDWTTDTAVQIGKILNVSPAKIDHIVFGYGSSFARGVVEHGTDPVLRILKAAPDKNNPAKKWQRVPVAGTFYREGSYDGGSQSLRDFYVEYEKVISGQRSLTRFAKADVPAGRAFLAETEGERWRTHGTQIKAAKQQLEDLGDVINEIYEAPPSVASPDQKREALDRVYERMVSVARASLGKAPLRQQTPVSAAPAAGGRTPVTSR